ncbi:MAG: glycosyltransferase family A protein, partial [Candidatus Zixiibacteriota bacterium]
MTENSRLVSVIIPAYNCERFLAETIESVLAQSYRPIEVIVVDDGSTDQSAEIARSYNDVNYIFQANQGTAVARNTGLAAAQGELIAFLDHDDVWMPNKLEVQVGYLIEHPGVELTICRIQNFFDPRVDVPPGARIVPQMREQINFMTMVARKEVFDRVGGFDPSYRVGNDFDWVTRAKDLGIAMTILPETLMLRRVHETNLSHDTQTQRADLFRLVKASI